MVVAPYWGPLLSPSKIGAVVVAGVDAEVVRWAPITCGTFSLGLEAIAQNLRLRNVVPKQLQRGLPGLKKADTGGFLRIFVDRTHK